MLRSFLSSNRTLWLVIWFALALAGCSYSTQSSSGADYLSRYQHPAYAPTTTPDGDDASDKGEGSAPTLDQEIRDIANIEPALRFPARIGVARVERRQLTAVPPAELVYWGELAERLGPEFGQFAPVSPMIAAMVDPEQGAHSTSPAELIADIRRGAARQHLDYVLVYELSGGFRTSDNLLSVADATILGYFVLPSRSVRVHGTANAILLDVRNGYPYGTAAAAVDDTRIARGSSARQRGRNGAEALRVDAVEELTVEVEAMITDLRASLDR